MNKKIKEMLARKNDLRLKALAVIDQAQKEGRFLTDEEDKNVKQFEEEMRKWDETIKRAEAIGVDDEPAPATDIPPVKPTPQNDEKRFASFGEQMMAVYRSASPDGRIDPRLTTRAASGMNESVPSDGGFLVQQDFVTELLKKTYETGILASKVRKIPISTNANGLKINAVDESSRANGSRWGGVQTYWENEADQHTASKPKFRTMDLSLKKLTGLCYATDELLTDAAALESVLRQAFAEEFGFKMDDAILNGIGSGQPLGILSSDALVKVPKENGQTELITVQNLLNMWSRLWARSRATAVWYVNQEIEPLLYTLKIGDKPVYIPAGGLSEVPYATLFGRPVMPLEQCSAVGEVGDIILADMSQYLLIDKGGINAASSIHVRFLYDESVFRFIYRVDGQPIWNKPLTPYKGSSSTSPFVALAKRN
ncbi:phage major capsid protein [Clostridium butyricum]|uniref:phage major capsid protein n=1 Tax=Clostridium butyricum TaxID=1492 RepID=UPI00129C0ECD|nr:phage major capsid protein [Clostridium butyricum]QGH20227.1 phage major capsid protein [Clostridium butyricum]QGH24262.1 phage major capsid protein [Clostridium butyricum]